MKQLTKILIAHSSIKIYHSDEIVDKKDYYRVIFNSFYNGYFNFVPKERLLECMPYHGQLETVLYVPTSKFNKNPEYWIDLTKESYENKFGKYKWYREPVMFEEV